MLDNKNDFTNSYDNDNENIKEVLEKTENYSDLVVPTNGLCECSPGEITTECSCDKINEEFEKVIDTLMEKGDPSDFQDFAKKYEDFEEKKRSEFIKSQLEKTQIRETISFDMDEDISNAIKFLSIKINSYSNLFATYMNSQVTATPNSTVLDSFLEKFTAANVEIEDFKIKNCKKILGEEGYEYLINNPFRYNFNFDLNKLQITRMGSIGDNNGCSCNK